LAQENSAGNKTNVWSWIKKIVNWQDETKNSGNDLNKNQATFFSTG